IRPIAETAYRAALELRSAQRDYDKVYADILERLDGARKAVEDSARYGTTMGAKAGDIATALTRLTENMRIDLLAKAAPTIDTQPAVLAAITPLLTEEEVARVEMYKSL